MELSTEATIALLTMGTVLPVGSLLIWGYYRNRQRRLVDEGRADTKGLVYPPRNPDGVRQDPWASYMRPGDGGIYIRIELDKSRLELLQDHAENNEGLARTPNSTGPSSGSELHELETLKPRQELA